MHLVDQLCRSARDAIAVLLLSNPWGSRSSVYRMVRAEHDVDLGRARGIHFFSCVTAGAAGMEALDAVICAGGRSSLRGVAQRAARFRGCGELIPGVPSVSCC